jgi:hypothetical protein
MALNALRTEMVTFTGTPGFEANGVTVGYRAEYTQRTSTEAKYHAIEGRTSDVASDANHKGQYYIQLGEQLYDGKLKLNNNDQDVFGRPSRKWEYDGKGIGTYAKTELLDKEYVGEVTGKDLFDLLGSTTLKDYTTYAFIDGVWTDGDGAEAALGSAYFNAADMNKNNKAKVGDTGTGTLTQVYVDHDKETIYVVVINTYLAFANKDYDTKKEQVDIAAYSLKKDASISEYIKVVKDGTKKVTFELAIEDFPNADSIKKDDPLLITVADGEVQSFRPAEVLSAVTITSFKLNSNVTVDGTKYNYTTTAGYKAGDLGDYTTTQITNLKDRAYNIYLDVYGNLIGVEEVEAVKNYVFITGIDLNGSNRHNQTADASAIFLDGTMDSIKVNMTKSEWKDDPDGSNDDAVLNTWCTYTKNGDVYTVKEVSDVGVTKMGGSFGDATQVPTKTGEKLAQFNQQCDGSNEMTIDSKNYRMYGGGAKGSDYYNVYGDVDTVYLTAKLGELVKGGEENENYGIIDGVASVNTGIANTDLTVWTNAKAAQQAADNKPANGTPGVYPKTSSGVYGLYNDKGLIIAAVVIGEDAGTAKDLVYVHSSGLEEEIDNGSSSSRAAGDGLWTWTRKVVRNGEEVLLTEVGDYYDGNHSLSKMEQYKWYQVRTNASGNVIEAKEASVALTVYDSDHFESGTSQYVTEYDEINDAIEESGVKTVLYLTNGGPVWNAAKEAYDNGYDGDMEVKGNRTLAITNEEGSGIWFRDDVNVVLQYWNRNKQEKDIMTGEGVDDLKEMVDIVNDNNRDRGNATYFVSALIEDGRATTIVIYDSYNNYKRPGDTEKPETTGDVSLEKDNTVLANRVEKLTGTTSVSTRGTGNWRFTITAPEWVADTATVVVSYDLMLNGVLDTHYTTDATALTGGSATISKTENGFQAGDEITIVVTEVTYSAVKVNVVDKDNGGNVFLTSTAANNTLTIPVGATQTLKFEVDGTKYDTTAGPLANATYAVTGAVTDDTGAAISGTGVAGTPNSIGTTTVTGDSAVTITVTGLTLKAPTYSVTVDPATLTSTGVTLSEFGVTGATDKTTVLKVSVNPAVSGKEEGWRFDTATVKVSLGVAPTDVYAYKITIAGMGSVVLNSTYTANAATALSTDTKVIPLTEDIKITQDMISVTVVEKKMAIESASWENGVLTVKFSADVLATSATKDKFAFAVGTNAGGSANTNASVVSSAVVKGDTVEITFSGDPLVEGNTVTVDKGVASNVTNTNVLDANKNYVITLNDDGTTTIAKAT